MNPQLDSTLNTLSNVHTNIIYYSTKAEPCDKKGKKTLLHFTLTYDVVSRFDHVFASVFNQTNKKSYVNTAFA